MLSSLTPLLSNCGKVRHEHKASGKTEHEVTAKISFEGCEIFRKRLDQEWCARQQLEAANKDCNAGRQPPLEQ